MNCLNTLPVRSLMIHRSYFGENWNLKRQMKEASKRSGDNIPRILDFSTTCNKIVTSVLRPAYPRGNKYCFRFSAKYNWICTRCLFPESDPSTPLSLLT